MVLLLKMITNLRSRGAPAAIKCSRLWNAATSTSWHILRFKNTFSIRQPAAIFLGTHFPYSQLSRLPRVEKCPICFYCHRRDDIRSFLCYVVVKNQPRHKGNDVIIPFLILIQAELEKNAWNMLRFFRN